ncbi:MAG: hypothetical protein ACF8XB_01955 [Planctomycetota bacterium JB042]
MTNRRRPRVWIVGAALGAAGCAHYAPHPVHVPPEPVRAESASGGVSAEYVETDLEGGDPLVSLSVAGTWSNGRRAWDEIRAITVLTDDWAELVTITYEEPVVGARRAVRFAAPVGDGERRLIVLVDRIGAPQQRCELRLTPGVVHLSRAPVEETRARSPWLTATYPLWGLPRDLIDAPLTALNRFGLGKIYGGRTFDEPLPPVVGLYAAAGIAGAIWGVGWGFHEAGHHYLQSYLYATGGLLVGVAVGAGGVLALDAAWGAVVNPLQVALLRTGIDDEYVKTADPVLRLGDRWTDADVRRHDALLRTHAWFPNWNYVVHERTLFVPPADDGVPVRTVERIEVVEAAGDPREDRP